MGQALEKEQQRNQVGQVLEKKQKRSHVWSIHPTEIKDRADVPFGLGGFGQVYMATYKNKLVAVKELFCRLGKDELVEFRREIAIWHKLEHPHILPLLGACDTSPKPFTVSPFMPNGTLNQYLACKPANAQKLRIMSEVASGLAYLHDNNIVHGDISCRNILLDENWHAVISDFALARTQHISSNSNYATHGQKPAGSLQYMAPEMLDWKNTLGSSKKTDVYAFGILFYEVMINGGAVWVDHDGHPLDRHQIVLQVIIGDRPKRKHPDPELEISDDNVWSLIQACWRHHPQERPSFQQVVSGIKEINQSVQKKQKRHHVWHIDPNDVKDREDFPFGAGGFGEVFKATYNSRPVAVKMLLCRFGKNELNAFRQEIDIWHKLKHPHILPLLGACDMETERPFMVSPLMPNGTLKEYVASKPSVPEKLRIMSEIASGMVYLHDNRTIHGDISSMNILLDGNFHAVISDFGLSRTKITSSSSKHASHATNAQMPGGTRQYKAPEMLDWKNPSKSSEKTDVYAYAILFYEAMINGRSIWVTADPQPKPLDKDQIELQLAHGCRPKRRRPDVEVEICDGNIWHLIQACWRQSPGERPSFELVLARTQELLADDSLEEQIQHCSNNHESHDASSRIPSDPNMHSMQLDSTTSLDVEKYANGISIGSSAEMAARLPLQSAGDRELNFELAWLHMSGVRAEQSDKKAFEYWQSVRTESNNNIYKTISTVMVGMCYYLGIGTELDLVIGRKLITASASDKFPLAFLAFEEWKADCMDWCGKVDCWAGNPENEIHLSSPASKVFFQHVIVGSEKHSLLKHLEGVCYFYGFGTSKNQDMAIKIFNANIDFSASQTFLGAWYTSRKEFENGKQWFTKAADQKHADAQYYLGRWFCQDPFNDDYDLVVAVYWFQMAADQGHALAQYKLGSCFYKGIGVSTKDYIEAAKWFQKASDQGHAEAQSSLEKYYADGHGVQQGNENRVNENVNGTKRLDIPRAISMTDLSEGDH